MKYTKKGEGKIIKKSAYTKEILLTSKEINSVGNLLQIVTIEPNKTVKNHYHNKQTEVYYILQGEADAVINKKKLHLSVGDAVVIEPKDTHMVTNVGDTDFKLAVFKINSPENSEDSVWLE